MEESAATIGCGLAGFVAQDEEQLLARRIFNDRFELHDLPIEHEHGKAGRRQFEYGANYGGDLFDDGRLKGISAP